MGRPMRFDFDYMAALSPLICVLLGVAFVFVIAPVTHGGRCKRAFPDRPDIQIECVKRVAKGESILDLIELANQEPDA